MLYQAVLVIKTSQLAAKWPNVCWLSNEVHDSIFMYSIKINKEQTPRLKLHKHEPEIRTQNYWKKDRTRVKRVYFSWKTKEITES